MKKNKELSLGTGIYTASMEDFFLQRRMHYLDDFAARHRKDLLMQQVYDRHESI